MGAKQSKRSVDISGKEAENVGEVAAAGAGGEGRMEPLADADALKPQVNGDAHIHEQSEKEKQLDSGTPENEKDATTEKEEKKQEEEKEKEKEAAPVANGESEQKENGDSSPAPEEGKKPKKEKVKKKWSLRSISFSRKEKPKQEKKQKDEEPKTNGEPEKLPEETAETTPESPKPEIAEESKPEAENKDEKTPETPVTEPITNGSSTPETPAAEEPAAAVPETNRPEAKVEPEQLPVNGLSLEEPKHNSAEAPQSEESKPEEPIAVTTESTPAPEIPVIKEVCVEQLPLIESTPPPLPANPPPSSVASFAATTMAPELTDASLANTTESAIISPSLALETKPDLPIANKIDETPLVTNVETELNQKTPSLKEVDDCKPEEVVNAKNETQSPIFTNTEAGIELAPRLNDVSEETPIEEAKTEATVPLIESSPIITNVEPKIDLPPPLNEVSDEKIVDEVKTEPEQQTTVEEVTAEPEQQIIVEEQTAEPEQKNTVEEAKPEPEQLDAVEDIKAEPEQTNITEDIKSEPEQTNSIVDIKATPEQEVSESVETSNKIELINEVNTNHIENNESESINLPAPVTEDAPTDEISESEPCISPPAESDIPEIPDALDSVEDLPPPPPLDDDLVDDLDKADKVSDKVEVISNHVSEIISDTNGIDKESINGIEDKEENMKGDHVEESKVVEPPACNGTSADPQETLVVSDKIADLIPEVPVVPELKTETESEVALAN